MHHDVCCSSFVTSTILRRLLVLLVHTTQAIMAALHVKQAELRTVLDKLAALDTDLEEKKARKEALASEVDMCQVKLGRCAKRNECIKGYLGLQLLYLYKFKHVRTPTLITALLSDESCCITNTNALAHTRTRTRLVLQSPAADYGAWQRACTVVSCSGYSQ